MAATIVRIVADRFGVSDGCTIDLATGAPVVLKIESGGDRAEQTRWSARCQGFYSLHHPRFATLLDYGALGTTERFEAWRSGSPCKGDSQKLEEALRSARRFLQGSDLTGNDGSPVDARELRGRVVLVPCSTWGYPRESGVPPSTDTSILSGVRRALATLDDCGISAINRRADLVLDDLFASVTGARPYVVSLSGPKGSGRTTMATRSARLARVHGFVPIAAHILPLVDRRLLSGRQVCLLDHGLAPKTALLTLAAASCRAHVLVHVGSADARGACRILLESIPAATLAAAVRPAVLDEGLHRSVVRLAAVARGLPGRFARLLWPGLAKPSSEGGDRRRQFVWRVAEREPAYGEETGEACATVFASEPSVSCVWPVPGELVSLRRRAEAASELLRDGRHAPGVRQLRQVIGALIRRGDRPHAASSMLVLAGALQMRGDTRRALTVLGEAHACAERARLDGVLVDVAVSTSHAWTDLARLDDAEATAASALAAARCIGDASRVSAASLALGRCLFWKGQYDEALTALKAPTSADTGTIAPELGVAAKTVAARAWLGVGDFAQATARAQEAQEEATGRHDARSMARAFCGAAFVHLALGDEDALKSDIRRCIAAATAAHDPMLAIRARLLGVEFDRRRERRAMTTRFVRRVCRVTTAHLPPIVRARLELIHDLMQSPEHTDDVVARHVSRSGLGALPLYAGLTRGSTPSPIPQSAEDIIGILKLCQTAIDEHRILVDLCGRLRAQLHAAAVAVFIREGTTFIDLARDGPRLEPETASRAVDGDIPVAPHQLRDRLEAAAPVRYGAAVIGALSARWTAGTPYDLSRAASVLTLAATAAAPVVSAALARRGRAAEPAVTDLMGATPAMSELRHAIERAARAPFAVLIEGESGSGKEVVAKAIHKVGLNRDRPLCTLNCAALPDDLVEAELFGHARGAFTGAINERAGVFEEAHGGTLLLDEVGELSLRAQAKLLRVIQEGELRRIGENHSRRVDVRIVAATNRDLRQEVAAGRFRLDLLYRLDVIRLHVPALRDRREDIPLLAGHLWQEAAARIGSRAVLAAATLAALARYDWPGNVRELQNVLAALAVRSPRRGVVPPAALPPPFAEAVRVEGCRLDDARRVFEERFVRAALVRSGGHRARAAAELGVTRQGLTKLMARLGI
ncbi:MAG TPA: sigma-54 dependent transcriptional regulator [Vicinamibacterales bacterium]|nr:sigma-54 dependent transcriptional regulator [Vicinamibacterales bacterium]